MASDQSKPVTNRHASAAVANGSGKHFDVHIRIGDEADMTLSLSRRATRSAVAVVVASITLILKWTDILALLRSIL